MRLRKTINRPQKLQDEMVFGKSLNDPTKPTFPNLLRSQVVPFNPLLPPAAFPSLPFPTESSGRDGDEASVKKVADIEAQSVDHAMSDDDALFNTLHPKSRRVPSLDSPFDVSFEDEMASSDENEDDLRNNDNDAESAKIQAVDGGHLNPQVTKANTLDWKYLGSAVRLSIINTMSQHYPLTKVYDMLRLYAQELGDIRKLVIQYNHQTEMEDYLAFWMRQDQLNGILRTDHTSKLRGAPHAYQEFQTQSYMRKIQAEVDESLLHATSSEVNLGKRFLAQQGIQLEMIGSWKSVYSYTHAPRPLDRKIHLSTRSLLFRSGLDSGYASAINSPNIILTSQEAGHASASSLQNNIQTGQAMGSRRPRKPMNARGVRLQKMAIPAEVHEAQLRKSHDPHSDTLIPAKDAFFAGSGGRSRRNIRPNPRYEEAMAELKLKGSGNGVRSDDETSDKNEQGYVSHEPPKPSPRLRITFDNHVFAVPTASLIPTVDSGSSAKTTLRSATQQMPPLGRPGNSSLTSEKLASPSPLQRVIVRPPKAVSRPEQQNVMPRLPEGLATNTPNQSLLGLPSERNDLAKSLLNAVEKNATNATPWISVQQKDVNEPMPPPVSDPRKRSGTVAAPAFSPITENFPSHWNQEPQETEAAVHSTHETGRSRAAHITANDGIIKSSLPAMRGLSPSPTPAPADRNAVWSGRSIVTETGSPVPHRKGMTSNSLSAGKQNGTSTAHDKTSGVFIPASQKPRTGPALTNVPRTLDPITGNIILDSLTPLEPSRASSPGERSPDAPSPKEPVTPAPRDEEGEVQMVPAAITNATKESSKTTRPTTDSAAEPPKGTRRRRAPKSVMRTTKLSSQPDVGEKRKYSKSEAQKQKELARAGRMEQERREREVRLAAKAAGGDAKAKRAERAAAAPPPPVGD